MTREEINEASLKFKAFEPICNDDLVDFALAMVQRHNEECAKICEVKCTGVLRLCHERDAAKIRAAKPK
jgi:pantothenate kinase